MYQWDAKAFKGARNPFQQMFEWRYQLHHPSISSCAQLPFNMTPLYVKALEE